MKKSIIKLLCVLTLISMSACGVEDAGENRGAVMDVVREDVNFSGESEIIFDDNDLIIKITSVELMESDIRCGLYIENNSTYNLAFGVQKAGISVNNLMVPFYDCEFDCEVASGKSANAYLNIDQSVLDADEIKGIERLDILLWVFDNDDEFKQSVFNTGRIGIVLADGTTEFERSGQELLNEDDIAIKLYINDERHYEFLLCNNSGKDIYYEITELSVNGCAFAESDCFENVLFNGKQALFEVEVSEEFLRNNGLEKVDNIEFNVNYRSYQNDDYNIMKIGPVIYELGKAE